MNGEAFNLQVEVYIFSEETSITYGGVCENKCPADATGEANCPSAGCTYTAPEDAVEAKASVPAACSGAGICATAGGAWSVDACVIADETACGTAGGTWGGDACVIADETTCGTAGGTWSADVCVIADETTCGTAGGTWSEDACVIADETACGTAGGTWSEDACEIEY
jgi:hypothetical protein